MFPGLLLTFTENDAKYTGIQVAEEDGEDYRRFWLTYKIVYAFY